MEARSFVAFCVCGCGKIVFAAAETIIGQKRMADRIALLIEEGHRTDFVSPDYVRRNWNEHEGTLPKLPVKEVIQQPIQLTLF